MYCCLLVNIATKLVTSSLLKILTPGDDGYKHKMKVSENDDEFMEHKHGFSAHPGHGGHREIVDEEREDSAADLVFCASDSDQEEEKHKEHCNA